MALLGLTHVMGQRPATASTIRNHDITAMACQQTDRCRVDVVVQRTLSATGHQGNPMFALANGGVHLRVIMARGCSDPGWGQIHHRAQLAGDKPPERLGQLRASQSQPESPGIGQDFRQQPAQPPIVPRPGIGFFDMLPRMIDQVHVMNAGRACGHASKTGQTPVDMFDRLLIRGPVVFQHVLDQIDPAPRGIELIPQNLVRWTGRRAKPTMNAGPQDLVRRGDLRVGQLSICEVRLHQILFLGGQNGDAASITP